MPKFARKFAVDLLAQWDALHPGNAVRALFERWVLPGQQTSADRSLRLCVRKECLNFYHLGQSVAEVRIGPSGPRLKIHKKYALELNKGKSTDLSHSGYCGFGPEMAAMQSTADKLDGWIAAAETYASAEKRFVDDLVAANPGVIDLEMGLPSRDDSQGNRVAPRMDLVILQAGSQRPIELAFWEAKCSTNPEVRARAAIAKSEKGGTGPPVVTQLAAYTSWINAAERADEIRLAYKETARLLLAFHHTFARASMNAPECVRLWQALAKANRSEILVVDRPGLVIGNYCPSGYTSAEIDAFARNAASFTSHGHRTKLQRHGITLHEVGPEYAGHLLPKLTPA